MAGKPFLSGRIPQDLHERIKAHVEETGIPKTELMVAALRQYLNCPEPPKIEHQEITRLESLITEIAQKVQTLEAKLVAIENKERPVNIEKKRTSTSQPLFSESSLALYYDNATDNNSDNAQIEPKQDIETFPKYSKSESGMAETIGKARSKLRSIREKRNSQTHKTAPADALIEDIDGEKCQVWLWKIESQEGKRNTYLWAAHPIDDNPDNS